MRVLITGGAGFVGSNVAAVAADRGHEVVCTVRSAPPLPDPRAHLRRCRPPRRRCSAGGGAGRHAPTCSSTRRSSTTSGCSTRSATGPGRRTSRSPAPSPTRRTTQRRCSSTSRRTGSSTARSRCDEATPPNPVNLYGFLKAASELVALERAHEAAVARISGVMGRHRARPELPRAQDAGFGYFVAALVDTLARGDPFTVWESDAINMRATPSLASHSAELILLLAERRLTGVFHCCGREAATRMELARAAADVFELDSRPAPQRPARSGGRGRPHRSRTTRASTPVRPPRLSSWSYPGCRSCSPASAPSASAEPRRPGAPHFPRLSG